MFLYKLEKKFGKFAINNLMKYIIVLYAAGTIISLINPMFYYSYLMLDIDKVLSGQIWRLVTFLIQPLESNNIVFQLIMLFVYYSLGTTLERAWGAFRFNMFYFTGVLFNILAVVIIYIATNIFFGVGFNYPISLYYINMSLFLAFTFSFPETQFLFMFLIPVKAKYMSVIYLLFIGYDVFKVFKIGGWVNGLIMVFIILISMANLIIYVVSNSRVSKRGLFNMGGSFRRSNADVKVKNNSSKKRGKSKDNFVDLAQRRPYRHKCAVCGRTELDDENLEFRYCSKCQGIYEYCSDHLYTHTHVMNGNAEGQIIDFNTINATKHSEETKNIDE